VATMVLAGGANLANSSTSERVIICPLARGVLIPCCEPLMASQRSPNVQPICCPRSTACPAALTIGSSPNPSKSTDKVVVSGHMAAGAAGTQIALWQRLPGQPKFKQMTQSSTDSSGAYKITRAAGRVQTNREWYVTAGAMRSTTITQQVQATVKLAARIAGPGRFLLTGGVSPGHPRERVVIERKSGTTWTAVAHPRLNRHSRFSLKLAVTPNRIMTVRAVLPADSRNILSTSPAITIGSLTGCIGCQPG
jgi:hypothetical protein